MSSERPAVARRMKRNSGPQPVTQWSQPPLRHRGSFLRSRFGPVRITAPHDLGVEVLARLVRSFTKRHPAVAELARGIAPCYAHRPMRDNIRLVSTAGTGYTYYTKKNKRTQTAKMEIKKYDPKVRQHVVFKEAKMPPHSK